MGKNQVRNESIEEIRNRKQDPNEKIPEQVIDQIYGVICFITKKF